MYLLDKGIGKVLPVIISYKIASHTLPAISQYMSSLIRAAMRALAPARCQVAWSPLCQRQQQNTRPLRFRTRARRQRNAAAASTARAHAPHGAGALFGHEAMPPPRRCAVDAIFMPLISSR